MKPLIEFLFYAFVSEDNPHDPVKYSVIIFSTGHTFPEGEIIYADFYEPLIGLDVAPVYGDTLENCLYEVHLRLTEMFGNLYSSLVKEDGFTRKIDYSKYGIW